MAYVNLHANFPPALGNPIEEYEACLARNQALADEHAAKLEDWKALRARYDKYLAELKAWKKANDKRAGQAMGLKSAYARAQNSYSAARKAWQARVTAYENARAYNRDLDAQDKEKRDRVERKYGIKFPADEWCTDPADRADIDRACEIASVKGIGATFSGGQYPPCAIAELNTCRPRKQVVHPGPMPTPPQPPALPPAVGPAPQPVPDPGPKPPNPPREACTAPRGSGGIATFGLIAVLVAGGGVLGYRAYKKRKKAA